MPKKLSELLEQRKKEKENAKGSPTEPEYVKKERNIRYFIKDGIFTSIKTGFTESFIMPFAIALNASTGMLAAFASVPQLVASFFQLFSQEGLRVFKSRTRLMFWTAFIHSLMWLPLLIVPFLGEKYLWLALLIIVLESTLGTYQGPIFNSIIGDTVSDDKRGEFFGKRNRIVNLMNFIATTIAGLILGLFTNIWTGYVFFGFAILFVIAFASRMVAAFYKRRMYDF